MKPLEDDDDLAEPPQQDREELEIRERFHPAFKRAHQPPIHRFPILTRVRDEVVLANNYRYISNTSARRNSRVEAGVMFAETIPFRSGSGRIVRTPNRGDAPRFPDRNVIKSLLVP
jgi:hypothetical protein